jgi:hypothetical protein
MPAKPIPVRLQNSSKPSTHGRWFWSAWIEGPDDALDRIKAVRYTLHPTFPDPVRIVNNRSSKFAVDSSGFGEFTIHADVRPVSGEPFHLDHWLELGKSADATTDVSQRVVTLFVSFGATDVKLFKTLKKDLASKGIRVIGPEDASDAVGSWPQACGDVIASADAAAFVMSGELRGFAEVEVQQAAKHHKPIIPIMVGTARPSKCLEKIAGVHLDPFDLSAGSSDMLAALVKGAIEPRKSR